MAHTLQLARAGGLKASGCRAEGDAMIRVVGKFRKTRLAAERLHARRNYHMGRQTHTQLDDKDARTPHTYLGTDKQAAAKMRLA
ncbi:hypothetical protein Tcan_15136 [Toxocara canis]|uniref:Uncharacterized protein n=1 Tax=Toxocara canis TaxID=6265 RepID=A0A0B2V9H8_TOXCA|nr:hypothetical protein Tcan_15136 [Toxocara canis]